MFTFWLKDLLYINSWFPEIAVWVFFISKNTKQDLDESFWHWKKSYMIITFLKEIRCEIIVPLSVQLCSNMKEPCSHKRNRLLKKNPRKLGEFCGSCTYSLSSNIDFCSQRIVIGYLRRKNKFLSRKLDCIGPRLFWYVIWMRNYKNVCSFLIYLLNKIFMYTLVPQGKKALSCTSLSGKLMYISIVTIVFSSLKLFGQSLWDFWSPEVLSRLCDVLSIVSSPEKRVLETIFHYDFLPSFIGLFRQSSTGMIACDTIIINFNYQISVGDESSLQMLLLLHYPRLLSSWLKKDS